MAQSGTIDAPEPLPCPFCGELPYIGPDGDGRFSTERSAWWFIECLECVSDEDGQGVLVCSYAPSRAEAVGAWNQRAHAAGDAREAAR